MKYLNIYIILTIITSITSAAETKNKTVDLGQYKKDLFGITTSNNKISKDSICFQALMQDSMDTSDDSSEYKTMKAMFHGTFLTCQAAALKIGVTYTNEQAAQDFCNKNKFDKEISSTSLLLKNAKPVANTLPKQYLDSLRKNVESLSGDYDKICGKKTIVKTINPKDIVKKIGKSPASEESVLIVDTTRGSVKSLPSNETGSDNHINETQAVAK